MADHDGPAPRDPQIPGELFRSTAGTPAQHLAEALSGLDRATRNFARTLGGERGPEVEPAASDRLSPPASASPPEPGDDAAPLSSAQDAFEGRMREAEREAREYLDHAKRRAESLVATMLGAVEQEAVEMRREAEAGIRARWQEVEADAERHVAEGRRIAEGMVAERQERIAALSDGITNRALTLTAGMDDADRVRAQFDSFVRILSQTADQIAGGRRIRSGQPRGRPRRPGSTERGRGLERRRASTFAVEVGRGVSLGLLKPSRGGVIRTWRSSPLIVRLPSSSISIRLPAGSRRRPPAGRAAAGTGEPAAADIAAVAAGIAVPAVADTGGPAAAGIAAAAVRRAGSRAAAELGPGVASAPLRGLLVAGLLVEGLLVSRRLRGWGLNGGAGRCGSRGGGRVGSGPLVGGSDRIDSAAARRTVARGSCRSLPAWVEGWEPCPTAAAAFAA